MAVVVSLHVKDTQERLGFIIMEFELQGDEGDEERVKMNLIMAAAREGTLKTTETDKEIRFEGMFSIDVDKVDL